MNPKIYNRVFFMVAAILAVSNLYAQQAGFLFKKTFGGNSHDNVFATKQTLDGGFVLAGVTASKDGDVKGFKGGSTDLWIIKLNSAGVMQWQKSLGGGNTEKGTIIHEITAVKNGVLQNDGYIVGGSTSSSNGDIKGYKGGTSDMWVVRLNSAGSIVWQRTIGGSGMDEIVSLKPVNDGGFIIGGNTESSNGDITGFHGQTDILIVKLSASGIPVWKKTLGNYAHENIFDLQVLGDGSPVVLARIGEATPGGDITEYRGNSDIWVCRLSNSGSIVWQKTLGGSNNENVWTMLRKTNDGQLVFCGSTSSIDGDLSGIHSSSALRFWMVKLNQVTGQIIWNWIDNNGSGHLLGMNNTSDGGFILVGGGSDGDDTTPGGGKVVKISSTGITQWSKDFGYANGSGDFMAVQEAANGDYIAIGSTMFKETPGMHSVNDTTHWPDLWVLRMNSSGEKLWDYAYGGTGEDWYGCILPTLQHLNVSLSNYWDDFLDNNDNIFVGLNTGSNDGDVTGLHNKFGSKRDIWFVRLNTGSSGLQTNEVRPVAPVNVFPNPFRNFTSLSFVPENSGPVTLRIYNAQGEMIQQRSISAQVPGANLTVRVDLNSYAQGLYFYSIIQDNNVRTGKLIVQR